MSRPENGYAKLMPPFDNVDRAWLPSQMVKLQTWVSWSVRGRRYRRG